MFYDKQDIEKQENYKRMLQIIGSLSKIFSEAKEPYLHYRTHENLFAKYFGVTNNARSDDSADAYDLESKQGIGLKTWVGSDNQKIAEFDKLLPSYKNLRGIKLIKTISTYRNIRIKTTMNLHDIKEMIYHIVKRFPNAMYIYESAFDFIDVDSIKINRKKGNANNIYFSDGKHVYHFNRSKNTLYMLFDDIVLLDKIDVEIMDDPFKLLEQLNQAKSSNNMLTNPTGQTVNSTSQNQLCLRLYSQKANGEKFVADKSGLNQWNGCRIIYKYDKNGVRKKKLSIPRNPNELYIPYPAIDRNRKEFFPPRNTSFDLILPNGKTISAKVCQDSGKAIMSNPNKELGRWLLRDVFELDEGTLVTYEMLEIYGIDSVIFTKLDQYKYSIDFCKLGTYENFYGVANEDGNIE